MPSEASWIVWAHDASRLAHDLDQTYDIFVRQPTLHGNVVRLPCTASSFDADWSPDDRYLAVAHTKGLSVYDASAKVVREIPSRKTYFAKWDARGERLALASNTDLLILDSKSWEIQQTIKVGFEIFDAAWYSDAGLLAGTEAGIARIPLDGSALQIIERNSAGCGRLIGHRGLFAGAIDSTIVVTDSDLKTHLRLEEHDAEIVDITFSQDGTFLAGIDERGGIVCWSMSDRSVIAKWQAPGPGYALQFNPTDQTLVCAYDQFLTFYDLTGIAAAEQSIHYTTAKIALVGDSGVGKTGLGWRLTHDVFKETASTHGEQFWIAERLSTTRADGTLCEAILWDLAGQPDYRLIHALFLDDADLALIVFDPTNRQEPLRGVEFWLRALSTNEKPCRMMLVAARIDRGAGMLSVEEGEAFALRSGITGGYVATSALRDQGIDELVARIQSLIDWDQRPATVTTATFKEIKDHILALKESEVATALFVTVDELRETLQTRAGRAYATDDVATAAKHLANHGYVRELRNSAGQRFILLAPDLLNNLASSMVLEARRNPKGLGVLEERRLLAGGYDFSELARLVSRDREILLDAAATLFIEHNVCFRETLGSDTFLAFPSLINQNKPQIDGPQLIDGTAYTVTGAIENVYSALVVLLGYTNTFTRTAQWRNQAQYEMGPGQVCGFRLTEEREGEIDLVLNFAIETEPATRQLFQSLFEKFLNARKVKIEIFPPVRCPGCSYEQPRSEVVRRQRQETRTMFCPNCGTRIMLGSGAPAAAVPEVVVREQHAATRRTHFETVVTRLKGYFRDARGDATAPSCFISYAWGNEEQERWVERQLATDLRNAGVEVLLDRWTNVPAAPISRYIDRIADVAFVALVGTTRLREKYASESTDSVVAAELTLINTRLRKQSHSGTVIPLLLEGEQSTSFPPLVEDSVFIDFRIEDEYFERMFDLLLTLYRIPFAEPAMRDLRDTIRDRSNRSRRR